MHIHTRMEQSSDETKKSFQARNNEFTEHKIEASMFRTRNEEFTI